MNLTINADRYRTMNHCWKKGGTRRRMEKEFTVTTQTITQDTGQEAVNIFVIGPRHPQPLVPF